MASPMEVVGGARSAAKRVSLLLFVVLALVAGSGWAQGSGLIADTSGGAAPATNFCPSVGDCKKSWFGAVSAIRSGTPYVGQYLFPVESYRDSYNRNIVSFRVKPQPAESSQPSAYVVGDYWASCPNSAQASGGCEDEGELIANYISQEIRPGVIRFDGAGTYQATSNPRVEGAHTPYNWAQRVSGRVGYLRTGVS